MEESAGTRAKFHRIGQGLRQRHHWKSCVPHWSDHIAYPITWGRLFNHVKLYIQLSRRPNYARSSCEHRVLEVPDISGVCKDLPESSKFRIYGSSRWYISSFLRLRTSIWRTLTYFLIDISNKFTGAATERQITIIACSIPCDFCECIPELHVNSASNSNLHVVPKILFFHWWNPSRWLAFFESSECTHRFLPLVRPE
jgi:hypothetical protein